VHHPVHIPTLGTDIHNHITTSQTLPAMAEADGAPAIDAQDLNYVQYEPSKEAEHLPAIRQLISKDLSEPYSIYVYRYFLYQWGELCYMVRN
jgi:peptide alpha-N-acetyltransferase